MSGAERPPLRQRRLLETRRLIQRAALDLVAEHGSSVSVQAISEAAGVSPRTFFNHFASRDEALVPAIPGFSDAQRRAFLRDDGADTTTALERLITDHVLLSLDLAGPGGAPYAAARLAQTSPDLLPRTLSVFEAFKHRVAELVAERAGRRPEDLSCVVAADVALATARAAIHRWCRDPDHEDLPTTLREAFSSLRDLSGPTSHTS